MIHDDGVNSEAWEAVLDGAAYDINERINDGSISREVYDRAKEIVNELRESVRMLLDG